MTYSLEKRYIQAGIYHGTLYYSGSSPKLEMILLGRVVGRIEISQTDQTNEWAVAAHIPADALSDGVQSFAIVPMGETDVLDSFTIITGEPLEDDIRAETALLRAELDMLKRAFRRHCVETGS